MTAETIVGVFIGIFTSYLALGWWERRKITLAHRQRIAEILAGQPKEK